VEFTQNSSKSVHIKRCHPEELVQQKTLIETLPSKEEKSSEDAISLEHNPHCNELVLQAFVPDGITMYEEPQQEEDQSLCSFQGTTFLNLPIFSHLKICCFLGIEDNSQVDYLKLDQCIIGSGGESYLRDYQVTIHSFFFDAMAAGP
jgi:hypothetical protein